MVLTSELRSLILRKASGEEVATAAVSAGMRRLREDRLEKVRQGITAIPEVLRVLGT
jgi:type IV pilus assembly protein PilB